MNSALSAEVVQLDQKMNDYKRQSEQLQKDKVSYNFFFAGII